MHEIIVNLHMHTSYSDGTGTHEDIAQAALRAGIDAVIVTDHNVYVNGPEDYYKDGDRQVLLLVGEEIHDQSRDPQKNHLLAFGITNEFASKAQDPQTLIDSIQENGGLTFLAHPVDPAAPAVGEPDLSWVDWDIQGYNGIELWNGMSEFKSLLRSKLHAIFFAYNPHRVAHAPFPDTLKMWDELLSKGYRVVVIGGSDAHALKARMGPIRRTLFPYEFHFKSINTHLYLKRPLSGTVPEDRRTIMEALRQGHAFIGYDLPASTRGFRFTAQGVDGNAWMGDLIAAEGGVTLQIHLPIRTECHLIKDGKRIKTWHNCENCTHITSEPGVYRTEAYIRYKGKRRGWIFSNPIYVQS
jgi:hypothetical protein